AVTDPESGFWGKWGRLVTRRPVPIAAIGTAIVAVLLVFGFQLNPSEAQAKDFPGKGDAIVGRDALAAAGISPGAIKPFVVLAPTAKTDEVVSKLRGVEGITGATAPASCRKDGLALIEAIPSVD